MKKVFFFTLLIIALFCGIQFLSGELFVSGGVSLLAAFAGLALVMKEKFAAVPRRTKIIFYSLFVFSFMVVSVCFCYAYMNGKWQQKTLLKVGGVIGAGTLKVKLEDISLKTIKEYYSAGMKEGLNFSEQFGRLYPLKKETPAVVDTIDDGSAPRKILGIIYRESISEDKIVLVARCTIYRGIVEDFKNYEEGKGKVQARITITPRGGYYEVQN